MQVCCSIKEALLSVCERFSLEAGEQIFLVKGPVTRHSSWPKPSQWSLESLCSPQMRILFDPQPPTPEFLSKDFRLQPSLEICSHCNFQDFRSLAKENQAPYWRFTSLTKSQIENHQLESGVESSIDWGSTTASWEIPSELHDYILNS